MEKTLTTSNHHSDFIDLVRVFAICLVVLCHAVEQGIYHFSIDYLEKLHFLSKLFGFGVYTFSRLASCLFLIMTGYLLLDRIYDKEKILRFWKRNWLHLLICTIIWFFIYDVFIMTYLGKNISVITVIYDLIFFHKVDMMNVWYMPAILGIYVLIPFAAIALQKFDIHILKFPFFFFLCLSFGFPLVKTINTILSGPQLSLQLSTGFSGGVYCFYIICGFLVKKSVFKPIKNIWLLIIFICSIAAGTSLQMWAFAQGIQYTIWRDNPFILFASLAVFEAFSRIHTIKCAKLLKELASYSFAVYLVHVIIRAVLLDHFKSWQFARPIKVLLFWLVTLILSYAVSWLISRIPKVGNYLIYRK